MGHLFSKPKSSAKSADETSSLTADDGCSVPNSSLRISPEEHRAPTAIAVTADQNEQQNSRIQACMQFFGDNKPLLCTLGMITIFSALFLLIGFLSKGEGCGSNNTTCAPNPGYRF